jgi:hypothetical protein
MPCFSRNQGCQMQFFQTKNPNLVHFGGSCNARCSSNLWPFGIFYVLPFGIHILWPFGIPILWPFGIFYGYLVYFYPFWYVVPKNLATLVVTGRPARWNGQNHWYTRNVSSLEKALLCRTQLSVHKLLNTRPRHKEREWKPLLPRKSFNN